MVEAIRVYRAVMGYMTRDERIETRYVTKRKGEVPVEYYDAIDPVSLPSHLGNRVNIIIGSKN